MGKIIESAEIVRKEGVMSFVRKVMTFLYETYHRFWFHAVKGGGVNVMDEDWDNLVLLDACRYDMFKQVNSLSGRLTAKMSKGSMSKEFIEKNFIDRQCHDTVYITANPYVGSLAEDTFHAVISVLDEWDEDIQTVRPEALVEVVKQEYPKYDDKRIIVHFMQPHQPYLGKRAKAIESEIAKVDTTKGWDGIPQSREKPRAESDRGISHLGALKNPEIDVSIEDIVESYKETLEIVLEHASNVVNILDGKTVISADHGEYLGERAGPFGKRRYGHPSDTHGPKLRKVPWFVVESDGRRRIVSEPPERYDTVEQREIESRLEDLGYR